MFPAYNVSLISRLKANHISSRPLWAPGLVRFLEGWRLDKATWTFSPFLDRFYEPTRDSHRDSQQ